MPESSERLVAPVPPPTDVNPYSSPRAALGDAAVSPPAAPIGGRMGIDRFLAYHIDHAFSIVIFLGVAMNSASVVGDIAAGAGALGAYLGYYFLPEWLLGTTLGKSLFSLRVRQLNGEPCSASQAAIRTAFRFVEVNPLVFGALPAGITILCTKRRQRLGDLVAGTIVTRSSRKTARPGASVKIVRRSV